MIIVLAFLVLWVVYFFYSLKVIGDLLPTFSVLANAFMCVSVSVIYLLVGSILGYFWKEVGGRFFLFFFERFLVPYISTMWFFEYDPFSSNVSVLGWLGLLFAFSIFCISVSTRMKLVDRWDAAKFEFRKYALSYPMRSRFDMIVVDSMYTFMTLLPLIFSGVWFLGYN